MFTINTLEALEILDSRGRPTIEVSCALTSGARASAQIPSGASTGRAEAVELRDADPLRYAGLGCRRAVANVEGEILGAVCGHPFTQVTLDQKLCEQDGTPDKSRLGANALLGVSIAFARACAVERGVPLYQHFADLLDEPLRALPRLTINLFSGGKHAGGQVCLQDVLVVPASARTINDGLAQVVAVYEAAANLSASRYGARRLTADEGGLAPPFENIPSMFDMAIEAIEAADLIPGEDVSLALDVAASHFYADGHYLVDAEALSPTAMIDTLDQWCHHWPIVSLEDGLAEEDWSHWPRLRRRLAPRVLTLGDDLLCTNPARISKALDTGACDALLLKVNQIGTLTEALEARQLARSGGWQVTISARSGETEDTWLADLAVGWGADQIKVGSVTQSERLAKYNRLLAIERETGLGVVGWPNA